MTTPPDAWLPLRRHTAARIALGRAGNSLPTAEWLGFAQAHAMARDAVHAVFDDGALAHALQQHGFQTVRVESAAADRATYLRRPDLGRVLSERSAALLDAVGPPSPAPQLAVMVGDGLSATAVNRHALPLLLELRALLEAQQAAQQQAIATVALAQQARVALGDEVGHRLHAGAVLVLIGERPGLSSPDSLGAYLTWAPRPGLLDAQRNCVSNIRPQGLGCADAARKIAWLLQAALQLGATGVQLKDGSDAPEAGRLPPAAPVQRMLGRQSDP